MKGEIPDFPAQLMPHKIKTNPYIDADLKTVLKELFGRYMTVSAAVKIKWIYSDLSRNKSGAPELTLGTKYMREYNHLFSKPWQDARERLKNLLKSDKIPNAGVPVVRELIGQMEQFGRAMADKVFERLKANYQMAEQNRGGGGEHHPASRSASEQAPSKGVKTRPR